MSVDNDEIVEAFRQGYPKEYSIVVLSILNQKQGNKIAELEAQLAELKTTEEVAEEKVGT